jgi:sporulation protein YlmC with PRC-barrel domain
MIHAKAMPSRRVVGRKVVNEWGIDLGRIEELAVNTEDGRIAYAVLSFRSATGVADKLFAIPWEVLAYHAESDEFILDVPRDLLDQAPGFDRANWPEHADEAWATQVYTQSGSTASWYSSTGQHMG